MGIRVNTSQPHEFQDRRAKRATKQCCEGRKAAEQETKL